MVGKAVGSYYHSTRDVTDEMKISESGGDGQCITILLECQLTFFRSIRKMKRNKS